MEFKYGQEVEHPVLGRGTCRGGISSSLFKVWVGFFDHPEDGHIGVSKERLSPVKVLPPEPSKGSVVRHKSMSVAYVRPWSSVGDGGPNWNSTSLHEDSGKKWEEIAEQVVVIYDAGGAERYPEDQ